MAQSNCGSIPPEAFRRALLGWFRKHARALPWRKNHSPYPIWVSEVMLQQTQVATAIRFYPPFLRAFPSLKQLAQAPLERVLGLWSGLGYYRRARNLHAAARLVSNKFGGRFPADYQRARSLPGVGDYTARAVLSIAYQRPFAVVDGNVARVVARLKAREGNINQPRFRLEIGHELQRLLSRRQPGNFNQALMELGQTVCLPRAPRCTVCPIQKWCAAHHLKKPQDYPAPRTRRASELHYLAAAVIRRKSRVALIRGLDGGLLPDMWNFPAAFGRTRPAALRHLRTKISGLAGRMVETVEIRPPVAEVRHTITHRSIRVNLYPIAFQGNFYHESVKWFPVDRLGHTAVSQLARKIFARLAAGA